MEWVQLLIVAIIGAGQPVRPIPLAPFSELRAIPAQMEKGDHAKHVHQPWRDSMRALGIKRATVILNFEWRGKPEKITSDRVVYFDKYDSDCAQITDPARLREIRSTELEKELEDWAIQRTSSAHWFYVDKKPHARRGTSRVEILDDEALPHAPPILKPQGASASSSLFEAISLGDEDSVSKLVLLPSFHTELDNSLFFASSSIDDSCIINTLVRAGANPNAQNAEKQTPLMYASGSGYLHNVKALLDAGANVNAQNVAGKTALFFAQKEGRTDIVHLLEQFQP